MAYTNFLLYLHLYLHLVYRHSLYRHWLFTSQSTRNLTRPYGLLSAEQYQSIKAMANERHESFLTLQNEVLSMRQKQQRMQIKMENLEKNQKRIIEWKNVEIDPTMTIVKKRIATWEKDSNSSNNAQDGSRVSVEEDLVLTNDRVHFLMYV